MSDEDERYFRDVYDHLIRISDLIDSYRDLLTGAMDVYLSTVSNRLNAVMKQLAMIATIFLPLTFVTGFFGQNFGWMVGHIGSTGAFVAFGIGTRARRSRDLARVLQAPRLVLSHAGNGALPRLEEETDDDRLERPRRSCGGATSRQL